MLALVVPSLPSPSNTLPSHSAIPKVRSRTPTIVSDPHGSYSRFLTAALMLVVPLLPSPSIAAVAIHCCRCHPLLPLPSIATIAVHCFHCRPLLPSPSNVLSSDSAIPKVGSRTPTIVPDTRAHCSNAAILVHRCRCRPSLPSPSITAVSVHRCHCHPMHFPVIRQSLRFVAELLQLYKLLMAVI